MSAIRKASHAGSWYTSNPKQLDAQLTQWLSRVDGEELPSPATVAAEGGVQKDPLKLPVENARAIIGPHAGYSFSGPAAAYAYRTIPAHLPSIKRVFLLGPSHHFYLDGCALSRCSAYETPIGNLPVDRATTDELYQTGQFEWMSTGVDEDEHSMEMHAPYIRKVFEGRDDVQIVPILVGAISANTEAHFGQLLAPYLADPSTFFVVSSDFCHWGSRFNYTYYRSDPQGTGKQLSSRVSPDDSTPIHRSIRDVDNEGIQAISFPRSSISSSDGSQSGSSSKSAAEAQKAFVRYLQKTKNTVCGRHPIGVLLSALARLEETGGVKAECRFTRYEQSSQCFSVRDSSVSYASAVVRF